MADRIELIQQANELRNWAESSGVFSQGRSVSIPAQRDQLDANLMFAASAVDTFISKPITAIGYAESGDKGQRIFIYTRRKLSIAEKKVLSENNINFPVEFRVALPFSVAIPSTAARFPPMFLDDKLMCGSSISVGNAREAGTLGALLQDTDGKMFGLSCNHVVGGCSNARVNLPIVAPAILDVAANAPNLRTIGLHKWTLPFVQGDPSAVPNYHENHDSAIFEILDNTQVSSFQGGEYDTPSEVAEPREDSRVEKVGRTTRHTTGFVESRLVGPMRIDYSLTIYHSAEENISFKGSVYFEPVYMIRAYQGLFSSEGDSGAIVVQREEGEDPSAAIGMVIGGSNSSEATYMLPLKPVLDKLGLNLVNNHNIS